MSIQPIVWLDVFPLVASLPARMGAFRPGAPRLFPLRGPRKDTLPEACDYGWYASTAKWPEVRSLASKIGLGLPNVGPLDVGLARLEMLDPGGSVDWRRETPAEGWLTLRIALRTNPGVLMVYGTAAISPAIGMVNAVDPAAPHCALNMGESAAITLELTVRRRVLEEAAG